MFKNKAKVQYKKIDAYLSVGRTCGTVQEF